jgi:hypothetical protein
MKTFEMPKDRCPHCGAEFERASRSGGAGRAPSAGDIAICVECLEINQFDAGLRSVAIDPMELLRRRLLPENKELFRQIDSAIASFKAQRAAGKCGFAVVAIRVVREGRLS